MSEIIGKSTSRREFLKGTGKLAAASSLAMGLGTRAYAGENNTIQVALVGCGGRGTGAAAQAMSVNKGPVKLVAMADAFENRLKESFAGLSKDYAGKMDVPEDRKFLGFDAYRKAMDCLKPGDIVILATPPAFRWVHFTYAIQKKLNVFMEKPVTVDGPTSKRMLSLGEQASAANLKVGVGLMSRHCRSLEELVKRVQDGELGEIILQRGYRMHGPAGFFNSPPKPANISDLCYQIRRFHSFIWASGGNYSDFYIHIIDHLGWIKGEWPVKAMGLGGRHYRQTPEGLTYVDQNFDTYSVEYTYADGSKFLFDGRCMENCASPYASYIHGTKGIAIGSKSGDCGQPSSIYKGQNPTRANMVWQARIPEDQADPYQNEWNDLVDAIRADKPYNEVKRGVEASVVTSMGRMSAHTGQEITFEQMLNCPHEMAPGLDKLTMDSPAPLMPDANGRYPVPQPGIVREREY